MDSTRIIDGQPGAHPRISTAGGVLPGTRRTARRLLSAAASLACGLATSLPAQSAAPRVALVLDQQAPRFQPQIAAFQREIQGFFRPGEITLLPPLAGDGTPAGVRRVLDRALRDSSVSVVVTLGPIGSHLVAHAGGMSKPAIAATIVDASWQGIPGKDGAAASATWRMWTSRTP